MPHLVLFISRLGDLTGCKILAINSYSRKMVNAADHVTTNAADHVTINAADHVTINAAATIAPPRPNVRARWLRGTNTIIRGANTLLWAGSKEAWCSRPDYQTYSVLPREHESPDPARWRTTEGDPSRERAETRVLHGTSVVQLTVYSCVVLEIWNGRTKDLEDVGVDMLFKLDGKLFRRYTCNADER